MKSKKFFLTLVLIALPLFSMADCLTDKYGLSHCGPGQCQFNSIGSVECSAYAGGGAMKNVIGVVVCGKGKCTKDQFKNIQCSANTGGNVRVTYGIISCDGGCVIGSSSYCQNAD